jgi:poly-gamma-glutamate synthesis protein (capsule biosynthesis protein)
MKISPPLGALCLLALCSCGPDPGPSYFTAAYAGPAGPEAAFLAVFLEEDILPAFPELRLVQAELPGDASAPGLPPDLVFEPFSCWAAEAPAGFIPLSRSCLVPRDMAPADRPGTTLADCLAGRETLVPPETLGAPFIALPVEGLYLGDPAYPLVRLQGLLLKAAPPTESPAAASSRAERFAALRALVDEKAAARRERAAGAGFGEGPPEILWIAAAGDLMLGRGAEAVLIREGPAGLFGDAAAPLRDADLTVLNLEGAVSSRGEPAAKTYTFRFSPASAAALGGAGIDLVLLANNHAFDWGAAAFADTLLHLEQAGVGVAGAGRDEEAAARPFTLRKGDTLVRAFGLASFSREASGWDGLYAAAGPDRPGMLHAGRGGGEKLAPRLDAGGEARSPAILDLVLFHGGQEWSAEPDGPTRRLYTGLIRAGADLVIGSHPHIVQGFEWIEGKPVFWSLGNCVFAGMENTGGGDEGLLIRLGYWGKRLLYLEAYPLSLSGPRTDIAPREKLEVFYRRSRELRERGG